MGKTSCEIRCGFSLIPVHIPQYWGKRRARINNFTDNLKLKYVHSKLKIVRATAVLKKKRFSFIYLFITHNGELVSNALRVNIYRKERSA